MWVADFVQSTHSAMKNIESKYTFSKSIIHIFFACTDSASMVTLAHSLLHKPSGDGICKKEHCVLRIDSETSLQAKRVTYLSFFDGPCGVPSR